MKQPLTIFGKKVYRELLERGMTFQTLVDELKLDYGFAWQVMRDKGTSAPLEKKISDYFGW